MKTNKFENWGIKIGRVPEKNYYAIWHNLKTTRIYMGPIIALDPERSEFYDIGIDTKCNASCSFCYVSASGGGEFFKDPCDAWNKWMSTFEADIPITDEMIESDEILKDLMSPPTKEDDKNVIILKLTAQIAKKHGLPLVYSNKPRQVAIGSTGEPTIHPDFCKFLKTIYDSGVVPNYTTNGIILSDLEKSKDILEATSKYCGGVAVSFGNKSIRDKAKKAIENLLQYGNCKVMIHHIISDNQSVDELMNLEKEYSGKVHYHVLLPLMKHGRSDKEMTEETFLYLAEQINNAELKNVAFGANFLPFLEKHPGILPIWDYPREVYSKNALVGDNKITITPSSFDLRPILTRVL